MLEITRGHHRIAFANQGGMSNCWVSTLPPRAAKNTSALAADLDNVRVAWAWAVQQRHYQALSAMGQSLQVICDIRGLFEEGVTLFRDAGLALKAARDRQPPAAPARSLALGELASLHGSGAVRYGRLVEARVQLHEGYALLRQRGRAMITLGMFALREEQLDAARRCFQELLDLGRTVLLDSIVRSAQDRLDALARAV